MNTAVNSPKSPYIKFTFNSLTSKCYMEFQKFKRLNDINLKLFMLKSQICLTNYNSAVITSHSLFKLKQSILNIIKLAMFLFKKTFCPDTWKRN